MAITPGTDVTIQDEPLPRGPIVEPGGGISRQFFNWFQGKDRKLGEIISGVNLNRQNIVQLEVDYQAADGTLSNAYIAADAVVFANSEASNAALSTTLTAAYQSADTALQGQITTNAGNITTAQADITTLFSTTATNGSAISTLQTNLSAEVTNRTNADTALQGQITTNAGNITTNSANITTLQSASATNTSAIATLQTNLSAETTNRTNADTNLQGQITTNAGAISVAQADITTLQSASTTNTSAIATLQTNLSAEVTNRTNADTNLQGQITTNSGNISTNSANITTLQSTTATNTSAISTLTTNLSAEVTNRTNADTNLQGQITTNSGNISTNSANITTLQSTTATNTSAIATLNTNLSAEVTNRTNADTSLQGQITTNAGNISTNSANITTLQSASATNTSAIATLNTNLSAEVTNRTNADTSLQGQITTNAGNISTNAAAITTEATARASGDAANATNIATVRAMVGADGSTIPDWDYRDSLFWDLPSGVIFAEGNPFTGKIRSIAMPDGTYDFSSYGWRVEPGATYEIVFRWWNGFGTFSGYVRPLLHIPGVMWQSLRSGSAVSNINSATGDQIGDIIAGSSSGTDIYRYTIPSSVTEIQTRLKASFSGNVNFYWAVEMKKLPQFAEVANIAEAYATNDSATARLVWKVDTSTNAATIEQTAATGYSDGTWNGSAIKLSANLIELLAEDINFGTNTTYEDTYATLYTEKNSKRLRILGPFPAADDLVLWFGPTTVSLNSETKTNGHFCLATDGKIYLGSAELTNSGNLDFTYTNGFVKSRNGNGTNTSDSVSFTGSGGSGSGYTFAHELIVTYTTGPTVTLSNTTGSPITASATGIVSDEVRFFVQTTMTDSAGNKVTKSKGGGLFWDI